MRNKKTEKTIDPDLTKPLPLVPINEGDCFGKEWDMGTSECQYCADNEVCGILFSKLLRSKTDELEQVNTYLDQTDFNAIDKKALLSIINGMTSKDLKVYIKLVTKSIDDVAVVEWIKRFVRSTEGLSIKGGICIYGK